MIKLILVIAAIIVTYFILKKFAFRNYAQNTIMVYTGSLGSGKTYNAVADSLKEYKKQLNKWRWKCRKTRLFNVFRFLTKKKKKALPRAPWYVSNIGVKLPGKRYSKKLTKNMLEEVEKIPEHSVMLIDEMSLLMDQWSYNNDDVNKTKRFFTLFRHFVDGRIYVTAQNITEVIKHVRTKTNTLVWMKETKWLLFHKLSITKYREYRLNGDSESEEVMEEEPILRKLRLNLKPKYDPRAYRKLYRGHWKKPKEHKTLEADEIITYNKAIN